MTLFVAILIGAVLGWFVSILADRENGMVANVLVGIAGSVLGGAYGTILAGEPFAVFSWYEIFWSSVGAMFFITVLSLIEKTFHIEF